MRRRLLLFFLPSIYTSASNANDSIWNCAQNKDSKEWVCVGEKKPQEKIDAETNSASHEPVKSLQPAPPEAAESTPVVAEPAHAPVEKIEPQPVPAEKAEAEVAAPKLPVSTKADKDTKSVGVETKTIAQPSAVANSKKPLQTDANRPGWTCDTKAADKNWDCKLVGADPKGQARTVETSESGLSLLTPAFDHNEELTFSNLKSQLKYDPWQSCMAPRGKKPGFVPEKDLREVSPLDIDADYAEIFDNEIYSYTGNVEMVRADQRSVSNKASYDTVSGTLDLQGSVYYSEDE
ncbi:MAG TPA: LPS-assembly protein LptD, partial [Methylobacter sp.]